jgi:cell division protein FtsZ
MASMGKAMMGTGEAEGEGRASKATDMALNNPLIDDYTLKGAKGLLVNITGGDDLKLFEVDEAVNKVRSEVDPEAEIIIGSITDPALDGKMRVSIVATSLDGQQPESKSVINMVHRIQNRNPGYTDFGNNGSAQSFNFSSTMSSPVSNGANALKLENEVIEETHSSISSSEMNNEVLSNVEQADSNITSENIVQDESLNNHEQSFAEEAIETSERLLEEEPSNGLENFGIEEETPELFNSENDSTLEEISTVEKNDVEEDDLEIPAFLRRQKN